MPSVRSYDVHECEFRVACAPPFFVVSKTILHIRDVLYSFSLELFFRYVSQKIERKNRKAEIAQKKLTGCGEGFARRCYGLDHTSAQNRSGPNTPDQKLTQTDDPDRRPRQSWEGSEARRRTPRRTAPQQQPPGHPYFACPRGGVLSGIGRGAIFFQGRWRHLKRKAHAPPQFTLPRGAVCLRSGLTLGGRVDAL